MVKKKGSFIISLDFELYWGVHDKFSLNEYRENIKRVPIVVDRLLKVFREFNVKGSFATVGFLFFDSFSELEKNIPRNIPTYHDEALNPYNLFKEFSKERNKGYFFANDLINEIIKDDIGHEIATHTFSHYYCLEEGQSESQFDADIQKAIEVATEKGVKVNSIVFPRNQVNKNYLKICKQNGIDVYRGNEDNYFFDPSKAKNLVVRLVKLLDSYINLTGHHCYNTSELEQDKMLFNVPSSRFLRPASKSTVINQLHVKRIINSMEYAAKNGLVYHLWWHPHNFGKNTELNMEILKQILSKYSDLNKEFGFQSRTMIEEFKNVR